MKKLCLFLIFPPPQKSSTRASFYHIFLPLHYFYESLLLCIQFAKTHTEITRLKVIKRLKLGLYIKYKSGPVLGSK